MNCKWCYGVIPVACTCSKTAQVGQLANALNTEVGRVMALETAIHNLHKVRGRYHTQQSCDALFALVGLKNNIGIEVKND